MDSGDGSSSGVHEESTGSKGSNQNCSRHNPQQILYLETFFKECPHPDVKQRKRISRELGLEPRQIKFWFQNKRTMMKTQLERMDNDALRRENERVKCENLAMKETLMNALCATCRGPAVSKEEHKNNIEKLQLENASLKKEYERVAAEIARRTGQPISEIRLLVSPRSPLDFSAEHVSDMGMSGSALQLCYSNSNSTFGPSQSEPISSDLKSVMVKTAAAAMDELLKVLHSEKPLWTNNNGRYSLNKDCYEKVFMRPRHFKHSSTIKLESSKDSCNVALNAIVLVNMLLDSSLWLDLFPTLITKSEILHVIETGTPVNRNDSLLLMHEVMHSLSPLVPAREFYLLRYCKQVKIDTWAIVDVSIQMPEENDDNLVPYCWKLPSGCVIQDMPDGHSKVTWVELVEADYRASTHRIYRDLVTSGTIFGAERWISTLKQMCERAVLSNEVLADNNTLGATWSAEVKRSLMDLSHRMLKEFCSTLTMQSSKLNFHHMSETGNDEVQVSTRKCTYSLKPEGTVICVSTSLWLPLCPQHVFAFFQDNKIRHQWDFITPGNPVKEIMRAVTGHNPDNAVSVFQSAAPDESNTAILQESLVDILGYYLVFAPLDMTSINMESTGLNFPPVLPSGFVITEDGRGANPKQLNNQFSDEDVGSILTVVFQMPLSYSTYIKQNHMDVVADASTRLSSTVEKIKAALTPTSSSETAILTS